MRKIKIYLIVLAGILIGQGFGGRLLAQEAKDELIFRAMQDELERNKQELSLADFGKPFFLSYALGITENFEIIGTLGAITNSYQMPLSSVGSIRLLLGDYHRNSDSRYEGRFVRTQMPLEPDYNSIRRNFWLGTDYTYKNALRNFAGKAAYLKANPKTPEEEQLDDLSKIKPITKFVTNPDKYTLNKEAWENNVRELSAIFKNYPKLLNTSIILTGLQMEVYKTTSEGVKLKQPVNYVVLHATASATTDDGVKFGDTYSVVAARIEELPTMEELKKNIVQFADNMTKLRGCEAITEYYSGPILFEDAACSKIFIDNLLNQGGLFAYRKPEGGQSKRTIDGRIGKKIVDSRISIKNYTTLNKYNNVRLLGAYEVDAEGVVPEKEMTLVENGILKGLLNGRVPTLKTPESTGSSRFMLNGGEIAFATAPGTIHISVKDGSKPEKMKKALIKAAKEEGLDYTYIVRRMAGQASLIYKVNVKDGSETMVRAGDFSTINLAKIKRLLDISGKEKIANFVLNQQVLSSLIYPSSILIEDMEINKSELKKEKKPALIFPLERTQK